MKCMSNIWELDLVNSKQVALFRAYNVSKVSEIWIFSAEEHWGVFRKKIFPMSGKKNGLALNMKFGDGEFPSEVPMSDKMT